MRKLCLTFALVMGVAAFCSAQEQSLADLARQKSSRQKATHVYTDEDIPTRAPSIAAPDDEPDSSASALDSDNGNKKQKPAADSNGTADKSGSPEVEAAKKVVQAKQVQIDAVKQEIKKYQEQLLHETDDSKADSLRTAISNLEHNISVWSETRDNAQKVIDKAGDKDKAGKPGAGQ